MGIPNVADTALQSSSFGRLYRSVGMTLTNIVECRSLLIHAICTGLAGFRALILMSRKILRSVAIAFATCLHSVFWVCTSGVPSTDLPACLAGQLSGVSIRARSRWVPSFADCWHAAQFSSKASPMLVRRLKRDFIPTSEPPVASLSLSSTLSGKSGMRVGVGLLEPWFLTSALPMPRLTQSMTQATRPTGHFDTAF